MTQGLQQQNNSLGWIGVKSAATPQHGQPASTRALLDARAYGPRPASTPKRQLQSA